MNRVPTLVSLILAYTVALLPLQAQSFRVDPAPGSYNHAIVVTLAPPKAGQALSYRVAIDGTGQTDTPTIRYTVPLYLTALPGKQRTYRVTLEAVEGSKIVQTDQSVWTIDRLPPAGASAPGGGGAGQTPTVRPPASPTSIQVLSPVAGRFANKQLLDVATAGFRWVRYSVDGTDPTVNGRSYEGPTLISRTGQVDLRIAALGEDSEKPLTAEVQFTVKEDGTPPLSSQTSAKPLTLSPPKSGRFFYSFREQAPDSSDMPFDKPIELGGPPGTISHYAFRLRSLENGGSWGPDYRFFFSVDRRDAPAPTVTLLGGKIASPRTRIAIEDASFAKVYYTTDGSIPDERSRLYRGPFVPELPAESEGTLTVRARAYAPNDTKSEVVSVEYPFLTRAPVPPKVKLHTSNTRPNDRSVHVTTEAPTGSTVVYERTLDGTTPANPTTSSPRATPDMLLSVPRGANVVFSMKFATIDPTGALSPPSQLLQARVDEYPPSEPVISFTGGTLSISGSGEISYVVSDTGSPPMNPGPSAQTYSGSVKLTGMAGERVVYYVAAVATDKNGLRSNVSRGGPFVVDRRAPSLPTYWGISAGGIYNDDRSLEVESRSGVDVHYTLSTDGKPPEDPTLSSPVFGSGMQFAVPSGSEKSYVVKLRTAIGEKLGPVATIPFTIDRIPPIVPKLADLASSTLYNHPLTLDPPTTPKDETVYLSLSSAGEPGDPLGKAGRPFETPVELDAPQGQQRTYRLRLAARDLAGNTDEKSATYTVTIDRRVPPAPVIHADPQGTRVEGEVAVTIDGGSGSYRYEMSDDGSDPPVPTAQSPLYSDPIVLRPRGGIPTLYTILATAEDAAGNINPNPAVYRVLVSPPGPQSASAGGPAGSRSTGAKSQAEGPGSGKLVTGAENGGLYNSSVTLQSSAPSAVLRYEVDSNGGMPPEVTRFSPLLSGKLVLDTPPGDTRRYEVRVGAFAASDSPTTTREESISFTIDRTPPPPPSISGIVDNARYQQPESFTLRSSGGTIYYSLDKLTPFISSGSLSSTKPIKYEQPVTIGVGEASARYRIHAYTVDAAGNHSAKTPEWTVYFDRGVVYTAPRGNDANEGTSTEPVKSLERALQLAQEMGRGTIFLASGSYTLTRSHRISTGISILGDFDPKVWHQTTTAGKQATVVTASTKERQDGTPLFAIDDGGLSIENVALHARENSASIFMLRRSSLSVSNSRIFANLNDRPVVDAEGGHISLDRTSLVNQGGAPTLSARGASVEVSGSSFTAGETTGDSVLLSLADQSTGSISGSVFNPTDGLRTVSIQALDSKLTLEKSKLFSGISTRQSVGVFASGSTVAVNATTIDASADSHLTFGVQAQHSTLAIDGSEILAQGSVGATGVWADDSQVRITHSRITGAETSEFLYLIKLSGSGGEILGNLLLGAASGDFLGVSLSQWRGKILGNTLYGGEARGHASAIALEDSPQVDIVDNIVARPTAHTRDEVPAGRAISIRTGTALPRIIANDFYGYPVVLGRPAGGGVDTVGALNAIAPEAAGISGNISEAPGETFIGGGDFHLKSTSQCVGKGVDPAPYGGLKSDLDGAPRSAPYDIGALRQR